MEHAAQFRSLAAPQRDGQTLVDPPYSTLPSLVADNREHLRTIEYDVQGRSLADLAMAARRELVKRAIAYSEQYRGVPARLRNINSLTEVPIVLSGHQPQLFHSGVWYKNFVLGRLASEVDGVGVHLLIDSDLCRSASIRVPTGSIDAPRVEAVPYDLPTVEAPYEERQVRDGATLATFSGRVVDLVRPFVKHPLVVSLWPLVLERTRAERNLGLRLAAARHALEETWHNDTLELPQSEVCQLPEFFWILAHVLAHLPRFWAAHNDSLAAYRRSHGLRNKAQPVPDLAESDGWLEAPFWIWTAGDPRRRALFAQQQAGGLIITDRHEHKFSLSLSADGEARTAVEELVDIAARGVKIRTRALSTTLFGRLVLGDLFLHGIGGAKYDQVTDEIIRRFCGIQPPEFATVSATLRLPIERRATDVMGGRDWLARLRELRYHPEKFVAANGPLASEIIAAKRKWINTQKTTANASERHRAIAAANVALEPLVEDERRQIQQQLDDARHRQRARAILDSREYSFCLFERQHFERLLLDDGPSGS